jgi:homoserine kinase
MTGEGSGTVVRVPASSANLGPGFDVLGMALDLCADFGTDEAPEGALPLDEFHPASIAFVSAGGEGPLWMRGSIPMARGLGFSGAARVGGAALAVVRGSDSPETALENGAEKILRISSDLEGHGDNVVASLFGGIAALVDGTTVSLRLGPVISNAVVVVWIPNVMTSTDSSRAGLAPIVDRADAVYNLGRVVQFVIAIEHDDPTLLIGATSDRLHQSNRFNHVPGAADSLAAGVEAGAWCGWLSGSGPTVALLCDAADAGAVVGSLPEGGPEGGHCKQLGIDTLGTRIA